MKLLIEEARMVRTKTFNILPIMKNDIFRLKFFLLFVFFIITSLSQAQSFFDNPITGSNPSNNNPYTAGQTVATGVTVSGIGYSGGVNNSNGTDRYNLSSWTTSGTINTGDYVYWTITPQNCFEIDFSSLVVAYQRSGNGPQNLALRSSLDNYAANIWTISGIPASEQIPTISLSAAAFQNITSAVTFRLYGWNAGNGNGTFSINSFTFNGAVNSLNTAVAGTVSGTSSICPGSNSILTLAGSTGNIQWQSSTDNLTFSNIAGATSTSYTTPNLVSSNYYRAVLSVGSCPSLNSNVFGVSIINPSLSPINNSRCGAGTVALGITENCPISNATVNWYASSTGGTSLGTGSSYTTPVLNSTTTYYASSNFSTGAALVTVNRSATLQRGLLFDTFIPITLNSVQINTNAAGSVTLELRDNLNQPVAGVSAVVFSAAAGTNTVPLGWSIPAGSGFSIIKTAGTIQFSRTDPFTFPIGVNGVLSITSSVDAGVVDNTRYFYFYNWNVSTQAIPVIATINNQIAPTFTQVSSICSGATLSALPTTSNNSITGTWSPALNNTSTTSYTFTPTAGQCASTAAMTITVNPTITASVSIAASASTICAGTSVTFTATPTNGGTSPTYVWKKNGTTISGATASTYTSTTLANNDVITCVMTSNATPCLTGSPATSNSVTMVVNPVLTASVSIAASSTTICSGTSVTFTATPTNGGTSPSYQWKVNGTNVGTNVATYTSTALVSGDVITCVMTSNATPCLTGSPATSNGVTMVVNPVLTASVSIAASATTICAGTSVTFTATPTNGGTTPSYVWKKNGTTISGATASTYTSTALVNGDVITCVMTSNATPCLTGSPATSNSVTMVVNPVLTASVSIAASASTICAGTSATFTATPTNGGTTPSYVWKKNGTTISGATASTYTSTALVNGDVITCVMTSNATPCLTGSPATSNGVTMVVNPIVTPTFTQVSAICSGASLNALPTTSNNSITGAWSPALNNTATATYTFTPTSGQCASTAAMTITVNPQTNNTTTASACDSYTWSVNGTTYTTSGTYTSVTGCHTETLVLTITPSTNNTTTASACDSYTWSVNGTTYTTSGTYTSVTGCHTETLVLTITPSTNTTTTASACDSYTWSVNGTTYTTSGTYTSVSGCNTKTLILTITPSTNTTTTASACDSYTWNVNGTTYTTSGTYTSVTGCHTETLVLTITPSTNTTTTASACDSYTWNVNGTTYTTSGTYTSVTGCHTETLVLTITPSTNNTTTASACDSYTWNVNGTTYTTSGTYTSVSGCNTNTLVLTVNTSSVYYVDSDGDGFGSTTTANFCVIPVGGYSNNSSDCDDDESTINPSALELCNDEDDNCNGFVDEGCPSTIVGEEPFNSMLAPSGMYSYCSSFYGTLAGKFPSANAHSNCVTGEDVWYNFVAQSSGVTVFIGSYVNDIVIELQDANGNLVEIENTVNGPGTEVLTTINLIAGQEYRIGIRNNNGILNPGGAFSACVRHLRRGGADSGTSPTWPSTLSTCSLFKASYCGGTGVQYRYTWTGISGTATGQVFTKTQTSDYLNVTAVTPSLHAGSTYNVLVTAIYTIPNGAGVNEVVELSALAPSTITISPVANVALRSADQLSNGPRYRGSVIAALPWVCGVTNWRWRFTEVNPLTLQTVGLPIEQNRAAASNFINLNTVAALQYGKTYAVQSAPLFTYTGTNYQWGPVTYMAIIGSAGLIIDASQGAAKDAMQDRQVEDVSQGASQDSTKVLPEDLAEHLSQNLELNVYPNPSNGSDLNLIISGIESDNVQVKVYDSMGRKVESFRLVVSGNLQTVLPISNDYSNGMYLIEVSTDLETKSSRVLISK